MAKAYFWEFIRVEEVDMSNAKGRIPLVILLVTPAHTKHLDDQDPFVPDLLSRIFPMLNRPPQVDIVAAVVDQIPYPPHYYPLPNTIRWRPGQNRFEGFSVAVAYSDVASPDLWCPSNVQKAPGLESALQRPVLSFRFPCDDTPASSGMAAQRAKSTTSHVVRLPVANTLFYNGQPSTMFASSWAPVKDSKSEIVYACVKKMNLAQQALNMIGVLSSPQLKHRSKLVLDLQPLTIPRVIAAGLGNIVRELRDGRATNETMPASQELEDAVSEKSQNLKNPDQKTEVWALITPRTRWINEPQIGTSNAAHWIERGSRLHRVLSGGGGWGAKNGLLALAPDTDISSPEPETFQALDNDQVTDRTPGQQLEGFFKPGDIITFFRSRFSLSDPPIKRMRSKVRNYHIKSPPSVCFGSAPPTADVVQSKATSKEEPLFQRILVKGFFGMLSEQGMNYHVDREVPAGSMERSGTVVHTKIDSPYARFSITGRRRSESHVTLLDGSTPEKEENTTQRPTSRATNPTGHAFDMSTLRRISVD